METTKLDEVTQNIGYFPNILLIFSILLGITIRFLMISDKKVLEFDDAISILVASGHEGEYANISTQHIYPIANWVSSDEWKRLIDIEPNHGFVQIAEDLANYDVHPPLYFWILYLWMSLFGNSIWSIHGINIVIDLLLVLVLFRVSMRLFHNTTKALLVSSIWILNPIGIKTTYWTRQYSFFSLVVFLFAFLVYDSFLSKKRVKRFSWQYLWLGLVTLAGVLTHYYFIIFIVLGVILIGEKWVKARAWLILFVLTSLIISAGMLLLFRSSMFFLSIQNYFASKFFLVTKVSELAYRVRNASKTFLLLFSPLLTVLGLLLVNHFRANKRTKLHLVAIHEIKKYFTSLWQVASFRWIVFFTILPFIVILSLYLSGVSQAHTFSSRYLSYISPLVAIFTAFLIPNGKFQTRLITLLAGAFIVLGLLTLSPRFTSSEQGSIDKLSLQSTRFVVVDSINWGTWPGIVQYLNAGQEVYIDSQSELVNHPERWLQRLGDGTGIFASIVRDAENSKEGRKKVLELIKKQYRVEQLSEIDKPQDWNIILYQLTPVQRLVTDQ